MITANCAVTGVPNKSSGIGVIPKTFRNYATRCEPPVLALSNGANIGGSSHLRHKNMVDFRKVRIVVPIYYCAVSGNAILDTLIASRSIAASIEYPYGSGTRYQFRFSGATSPTLINGTLCSGFAVSDILDLGFTIAAGTPFGSYMFVQDLAHATQYGGVQINTTYTEGASYGAVPVDYTATGSIGTTSQIAIGPTMILTEGTLPCFAICGDSIAFGTGDTASGDANGNTGFLAQFIYNCGYGYVKLACPSERMNDVPSNWSARLALLSLANPTHIISEYGTNDLKTGVVTTLAQLQTLKAAELAFYKTAVGDIPVYGVTWAPRTISSDNSSTGSDTGFQTPQTNFSPLGASVRESWNPYIRGAPLSMAGVLDPCLAWEAYNLNSGYWAFNGTADYMTADETHPSPLGHSLAASTMPKIVITY